MKNLTQRFLQIGKCLTVLTLILFVYTESPVLAGVMSSESEINITADQVYNEDLFIGAQSVLIDGTVNGDVYIGANDVTVNGQINGDLIVGASDLTITGSISQDLRGGVLSAKLNQTVIGDNVTLFSGKVSIDAQSKIGGSVVIAGGTVSSEADIEGSFLCGANELNLGGTINEDANLSYSQITLSENLQINRNLNYSSAQNLEIKDSSVTGEITKYDENFNLWKENQFSSLRSFFDSQLWQFATNGLRIWRFISNLITGLFFLFICPKFFTQMTQIIKEEPGKSFIYGSVVALFAVPLLLLIASTLIGVHLAVILSVFFFLSVYFSKLIMAFVIGNFITDIFKLKFNNRFLLFLVGLSAYYLLSLSSFISFFISLASLVLGLGSISFYLKNKYEK